MSRVDVPRPRSSVAPAGGLRYLRTHWWALATLLLVAASALFATSPIRDAATLGPVPEASLRLPTLYLLFAPFSNLLDLVTLLSLRQHVAVLVTAILAFALWWWWCGRIVPVSVSPARRAVHHAARVGLALLGVVAVYATAVLLPRPMAALEVVPDVVVVDFHTHTKFSHDGRWNWEPEDVRAWHRDAGYDAAYITDHRSFEGARDAWANNPRLAGEGTSLLPGIEVVWKGEHVNVLDADRTYKGLLSPTLADIDEDALRLASMVPSREPVLIETLPGDLSRLHPAQGPGTPGVRAIEIVDGAPKGLGQTRRDRTSIVALADSLHLALVSGSDSHGWGHVAQAWTLMVVPQWRAATPAQLSEAIAATIRQMGNRGTRVVARRVADTDRGVALPLTVPLVLWDMMRTLSGDERISWVIWTLVFAALYAVKLRRVSNRPLP